MFMGNTTDDIQTTAVKIGTAIAKIKGGLKGAKDDLSKSVADQVTPKVAGATVLAAVLGSAVMLGLVLVFLRPKRKG